MERFLDSLRDRQTILWLGILAAVLISIAGADSQQWLKAWPETMILPVVAILNAFMAWFITWFGWFFKAVAWLLSGPVTAMQWILQTSPWPLTMAVIAAVSYRAGGWKLGVFSILTMVYMQIVGYWSESMNTLALVAISVPLSIATGFGFGALAFRSPAARRIIMPALDLLQTVPTFAYLIPILLLFGFGTVVGLVASLLYAFPPMVRNTVLGLERVSPEVIESGLMAGATERQLFWQVRAPSAMRQILLGVNQATMAALSMVIIASVIGGSEDIGWEVVSTMRKALFGESLLAGIVIALIAMVMDRVTWGFAMKESNAAEGWRISPARDWPTLLAIAVAVAVLIVVWALPDPAQPINDAITYIVVEFKGAIDYIKRFAFFFVMLPVRIGWENTVRPVTWGFELTSTHSVIYVLLAFGLAFLATRAWSLRGGVGVLLFAVIYYIGLTNMPWLALAVMVTGLAWSVGGWRVAAIALGGLAWLLLTGIWPRAVWSVYLCGMAVLLCFLIGTAIGVVAAHNDRVSAFVRPINDTLQTMPLFVLLIPILMIFKIGEFTALLAIMAYAIVPAIRYSEHALRNLPADIVEAATAMGGTKWQLLWQVKLPMALPEVMLGLNQTIMYGIAMLVIAALVGTKGLGQEVYIGLGDGDFGVGMVAGIGMAMIAIVADRITQGWSAKKRAELGMV